MKNSMTTTENDLQIISVVIPSLNGSYAKLLVITGNEYAKIKEASESNKGKGENLFALYAESNLHHEISSGMGALTRVQFDELLKESYNSKMQQGRSGKYLKEVL
jgi:hypothetical protein